MKATEHPLAPLAGESYSAQKQRFKEALDVVVPHMDYFYSRPTLRRFKRTPFQVRNVKQWGSVDWEVLAYWVQEYLPAEMLPEAWNAEALVA
jgi:hypothetical protein